MGYCDDCLTSDIAFNAVMPLSRASTRGRYSRIEGVTTNSYIKESAPRTHGNYRQASFHHVHMIHVRYFDNLKCGWADTWALPFLGQTSHL